MSFIGFPPKTNVMIVAEKRNKRSKTRGKTNDKDIIDNISANDALTILNILSEEDVKIRERITRIAKEHLSGADFEDIASQVFFDLNAIEVEELWDRSGSTSYGYVEPVEMAFEMFEETIKPFLEELQKLQKLSMHEEAKNYCKGILKGIAQFENESKTEYADWAEDVPRDCCSMVFEEWKKNCKNAKHIKEIKEFIKKIFPGLQLHETHIVNLII